MALYCTYEHYTRKNMLCMKSEEISMDGIWQRTKYTACTASPLSQGGFCASPDMARNLSHLLSPLKGREK